MNTLRAAVLVDDQMPTSITWNLLDFVAELGTF
jgi:hypothetical protein